MPHVKFRLQFWRCFFISCLCRTRHTSVCHWYMFYVMLYNVKHLWLITGFVTRVTRRVPLAEQELIILPKHLSSPPVLVEFVFGLLSFLCSCFLFVFFFLSDLLRLTNSDYPFHIFKLFENQYVAWSENRKYLIYNGRLSHGTWFIIVKRT